MAKKQKKNHYSESVKVLVEQGYSDEYLKMLSSEMETAKTASDKAEGMNHYADALLFRGELKEAHEHYEETPFKSLPEHLKQIYAANFILCLFLEGKHGDVKNKYQELNKELLSEPTLIMRRSVGIKEYCEKRYDTAVTIFLKLIEDTEDDSRGTLMADICMAKALIKLDMYTEAAGYCDNFARYESRNDIGKLCIKLKKKIFDKVGSREKVKMIKDRKKK